MEDLQLNELALEMTDDLIGDSEQFGVEVHEVGGAEVIDCGVKATGSLIAGKALAEICLAGLAEVGIALDRLGSCPCPKVTVETDDPVAACLLSQYAGWKVALDGYFAMGSGPMRAAYAGETLFQKLGYKEESATAVGVLEASKLPTEKVIAHLCEKLKIEPERLVLLAARTASLAGGLQIVARSVETCMHKLLELGCDVRRVRSAIGSAFLPPVPKDDLTAIERTNDSILYGAEVFLWIDDKDESIAEVGSRIPSNSSPDYGAPFGEIFQRYGGDFYKIDPLLFSPAAVVLNNLATGSTHRFGTINTALLERSFFGAG